MADNPIPVSELFGDVVSVAELEELYGQSQKKRDYTLPQAVTSSVFNAPGSFGRTMANLYKGATDNPTEFVKSIPNFFVGGLGAMIPDDMELAGQKVGPDPYYEKKYFEPVAKAAGRAVGFRPEREGEGVNIAPGINYDWEQAKRNLAERPVESLMEVAPFVPGVKIPLGKGRHFDPSVHLNPMTVPAKGVTTIAKIAGKVTDKAKSIPGMEAPMTAATRWLNPRLQAVRELPTTEQYNAKAGRIYDEAERHGIYFSDQTWNRFVAGLEQRMKREGFDPHREGMAATELNILKQRPISGQMSFRDVETARGNIGRAGRSAGKSTAETAKVNERMLSIMKDYMDEFFEKTTAKDLTVSQRVAGGFDPQKALRLYEEARKVYTQKIKSQDLDELAYNAELAASANYTSAGIEHAIRQGHRKLINNKAKRNRWTKDELRAIEEVVHGGKFSRGLGKLAPVGTVGKIGVPGVSAGIGAILGAPLGPAGSAAVGAAAAAGVTGAGMVGRRFAESRTKSAASNVRGVVAGGKLPSKTHPAMKHVGRGLAVGTGVQNERRKESLNFAEKTLGKETLDHIKATPALRPLLMNWVSARGGDEEAGATWALALAISDELNRPDLVDRIVEELGAP